MGMEEITWIRLILGYAQERIANAFYNIALHHRRFKYKYRLLIKFN